MSGATDTATVGADPREEIAAALRAEWRMIASVSLRPCRDGKGFEAAIQLDRVVVKGALEQQGYPTTPAALAAVEARRQAALEECVRRLNSRVPPAQRIRSFRILG